MPNTYYLTTLEDVYEKIPADKIPLCLKEMGDSLSKIKIADEAMCAIAKELAIEKGSDVEDFPTIAHVVKGMTWIDDGKEDAEGELPVFGMTFRKTTP